MGQSFSDVLPLHCSQCENTPGEITVYIIIIISHYKPSPDTQSNHGKKKLRLIVQKLRYTWTLTLVLLAVGLLDHLVFVDGDHSGRLGLDPGGCLGSLRSGLGTRGRLLAWGGLGGCRRHQGRQRPAFGGCGRRRSVSGFRSAGEEETGEMS